MYPSEIEGLYGRILTEKCLAFKVTIKGIHFKKMNDEIVGPHVNVNSRPYTRFRKKSLSRRKISIGISLHLSN